MRLMLKIDYSISAYLWFFHVYYILERNRIATFASLVKYYWITMAITKFLVISKSKNGRCENFGVFFCYVSC